ncbi:MAG: MBL fold metallo-hydrolase [Candidatus Schekmanbacteria bacterium]|nr:MBL fold metallo-hydrolase [Candidatus Schekmanbacteria bacterium]
MQIGKFKTELLIAGFFRLDGGASFGIIPKAIWQKVCPPDEQNRIRVSSRPLLIQTGKKNILIDTGMGNKWDEKGMKMYSIENEPSLLASLKKLNIEPEAIDIVINTHLHFDHSGGNTIIADGKIKPAFPKARYVIQKGEWEYALNPDDRSAGSYLKENYLPLMEEFVQVDLIEGDARICEGVSVIMSTGHTTFHQSVLIESEGMKLFYPGDIMPTSMHVHLPWVMAYDMAPIESVNTRKKLIERAIDENWLIALEHDPVQEFGRLRIEKGKFIFVPEIVS